MCDKANMHKHVTHQSHVCRCVKLGEKVSGAAITREFTVGLCSYATYSTFKNCVKAFTAVTHENYLTPGLK